MMDEPTITSRGFKRMPPILGAYGGWIEAYESSLADAPHLWIKVADPTERRPSYVHLPLDAALRLADQIRYLAEHHYQNGQPGSQS